jgi:deoxyribonucleoside regulator
MRTKVNKNSLIVEVARLYYDFHFSQNQIAQKIGISRPGVSRLLSQAREKGIVRIEIIDPEQNTTQLESQLSEKFDLKKVIIVPNENVPDFELKKRLGLITAKYLEKLMKVGITLGVSWGTTIQSVANQVQSKKILNATVVQLVGGLSKAEYDTHASEISMKVAKKYQALPYLLPLPAIVDSIELKRAIVKDKNISKTLELARQAEIALFSVGIFDHESVLVKADYFDKADVDSLLKKGAIGDICTHIITESGNICDSDLDQRTIGIELENLRNKRYSIVVAGGREKLKVIRAGLLARYFNVLITDEKTATNLLDL